MVRLSVCVSAHSSSCPSVLSIVSVYNMHILKNIKPFVDLFTVWYWRPDGMAKHKEFAILDPDGYMLRFSECIDRRPIKPSDEDHMYEY